MHFQLSRARPKAIPAIAQNKGAAKDKLPYSWVKIDGTLLPPWFSSPPSSVQGKGASTFIPEAILTVRVRLDISSRT